MKDILAIAFDKDGTLFNTEAVYEDAFFQAQKEAGVLIKPELREQMIGLSADKTRELLEKALLNQIDVDVFINDYWMRLFDERVEAGEISLMPEVESLLETLAQNYPLALVTSDDMERTLQSFNATSPNLFKVFSVVITVEEVKNPKPSPEPYLKAASLLGVKNENLLVVEDSELGVLSGINSGSKVLLYSPSLELEQKMRDKVFGIIKNHGELLKKLS